MNLNQLRTALQGKNTAQIAVATGLAISTIEGIKSGRKTNPTCKTFNKLLEYLQNELPSSSKKSDT